MTARFCIRCGDCHSDDSPICSTCSYAESPADYAADEETISATTLAELRKIHGDPLVDAYAEYLALRSGNLGLTETQSDPFKRRAA